MEFNYACAFVYREHGSWKREGACYIGIISIVIMFVSKYIMNIWLYDFILYITYTSISGKKNDENICNKKKI